MKLFTEVEFSSPPIMVAAWPGMGNVGLIAVDYLRRQLGAQPFAEMDMSSFFIPDSIIVKEGIAQLPDMPTGIFHFYDNPSLIIFESNGQVGGKDGITVIKTILDMARQFQVRRIYTAAAFSQPMSHTAQSKVLCACSCEALLKELTEFDIDPMPDGYIAGLNGLLLGVAASRGMEAGCFLGTIPSYATNLSYPKASLELLRKVTVNLGVEIDFSDLEQGALAMDHQLEAIEQRLREYFPTLSESDESPPQIEDEEVPGYIMDRIERLFQEVQNDRSRAALLKDELTRWNLYELYEHRFLDLFKESGRGDEDDEQKHG